jgi:hypothetical protein
MKSFRNQSGVALVITLIMLSVITVIAVAFLALSQRERSSISQTITGTEAELMANTALDRAKSQILAEMVAFMANPTNRVATNANGAWIPALTLGPDLLVSVTSTNYTNSPYLSPGKRANDVAAIADLVQDPRVPVFVRTPDADRVTNRFYLDLNRNNRFEPSGIVPWTNTAGAYVGDRYAIGDPEWVGVLGRINEKHSGTNRFGGRYAYLILPIGKTLDIDFIHNEGKPTPGSQDGYFRSQGHGSWEINLAAFLADVNNTWGYTFNTNLLAPSSGPAFDDALHILRYRYGGRNLKTARDIFGFASDVFGSDGIDQYANGNNNNGSDNDQSASPWPGAPNPQHFFTVHEFFNPQGLAAYPAVTNAINRLRTISSRIGSDNRHTFYRMLAQLGTDSAPQKQRYQPGLRGDNAPINLNYANTNDVDAADLVHWTPEGFFHTVADRLLRDYGFADDTGRNSLSVTNLQVYPTNFYTPAVHRILQMTLNIFDATATTNNGAKYPFYPTVLRPIFANENGGDIVRIVGYTTNITLQRITNSINAMFNPWKDLSNQLERTSLRPDQELYVYGVPVLIGAKKGFPNFNEYMFQTTAQVQRKIELQALAGNRLQTNHSFFLGISNTLALEAWYPYASTNVYRRDLVMVSAVEIDTGVTNSEGFQMNSASSPFALFDAIVITNNSWRGGQFRVPTFDQTRQIWATERVLPYQTYDYDRRVFAGTSHVHQRTFPAPDWVATSTNRLRFFLFEKDTGHLIDAVGLAPMIVSVNVTKALHDLGQPDPDTPPLPTGPGTYQLTSWLTNRLGSGGINTMTVGISNQMRMSWDDRMPEWGSHNVVTNARSGFRAFLAATNNPVGAKIQAGFTPQRKVFQRFEWQANDPLVHHLVEDLRLATNAIIDHSPIVGEDVVSRLNIKDVNKRYVGGPVFPVYAPWGTNSGSVADKLPATKDPLVTKADDWNFPTNKLATIGMLGRVHRGTPWQTIYLKSDRASPADWNNLHKGGVRSMPTNDWRLADIFTVAPYPTASRGRLSVNQTNAAAWSALLAGTRVAYLDANGVPTNRVIEPPVNDQNVRIVEKLVERINAARQTLPGEVFSSVSEFIGNVPELATGSPTTGSPFLPSGVTQTDFYYEGLLEKILSLVKAGEPRFVVYAFGQSLKPAPQSVIAGGPFRGLCVNYEVTGELAAKAVVRVDFVPALPDPVPPGGALGVRPQMVIESYNTLPPD